MHWLSGTKALLVLLLAIPVLRLGGTAAHVALSGDGLNDDHYIDSRELQKQGRLVEAIAEFDEAVKVNASSLKAITARGDAFYALGKIRQASEDYEKAIGLRSNLEHLSGTPEFGAENKALAGAYTGRALIQTARGDDMEAQRSLSEVVLIGVDVAEAREAVEGIKAQR